MSKVFGSDRIEKVRQCLVGDNSSFLKDLSAAETHNDVVLAFNKLRSACDIILASYEVNQ